MSRPNQLQRAVENSMEQSNDWNISSNRLVPKDLTLEEPGSGT